MNDVNGEINFCLEYSFSRKNKITLDFWIIHVCKDVELQRNFYSHLVFDISCTKTYNCYYIMGICCCK